MSDDGTVKVLRAGSNDASRLADTLAVSFLTDPVSRWMIPDPDERAARHPGFFRIFVDYAVAYGSAYHSVDFTGVALWNDVDPDLRAGQIEDADQRFRDVLGPNFDRFHALDALMHRAHPTNTQHTYLQFVGVLPDKQGHGVGTELITCKLAELDTHRIPAYLEASKFRATRLYERLGFKRVAARILPPDGPPMYPMWRSLVSTVLSPGNAADDD
jgi:ribosomal protein S18 acetylase RimI-like enzyme